MPEPEREQVPARGDFRSISLRNVYRFSYELAFRAWSWKHAKDIARLVIEPCNYWRNVEVPAVLNHLRARPGERVLDIGSPKLASLFLWYRLGAEVYATDLYPYFLEEYTHYLRCLGTSPWGTRYCLGLQDGRCLDYPDNYFDKVFSISVIEHIEGEGDSQTMREIARVLKSDGLSCLTVPFASSYRESTIDYELYYKKRVTGQPVFYQRHYDLETLSRRLIRPSGLRLLRLEFFGERWFPYEQFYDSVPRPFKVALSLMGPVFSRLFLRKVNAQAISTAKAALLVLGKTHYEGIKNDQGPSEEVQRNATRRAGRDPSQIRGDHDGAGDP